MNIPVIKFTLAKKEINLILIDIVRCPDGVYGICVLRDYKTIHDRTLQVTPIQQLIIPEEYYPELLSKGIDLSPVEDKIALLEKSLKDISSTLSDIKKQITPKVPRTSKKVLTEEGKNGK